MRFAALKTSRGTIEGLKAAIALGNLDFRDLLMSAGFGYEVKSYRPGCRNRIRDNQPLLWTGPRRVGSLS